MCNNDTNFYYLKDGKFRTSEFCTVSLSVIISIIDMKNKTIKENYSPMLGDLIVEVLYQDEDKNNQVRLYKIDAIYLLNDGSKVLQLKPGASQVICKDNDIMIIIDMLKTKSISLYTKAKSDTFYKTSYAYDKLPEDFATTSCGCLNEGLDRDNNNCNEGRIEEITWSKIC